MQQKKNIQKLKGEGNVFKTDQKSILEELVHYFKELYAQSECTKSQYEQIVNYIKKTNLTKITTEQKLVCDTPITLQECKNALKQLNTNKSPGLDDFTVEFYKKFWEDLKNCFFESIKYSINTGKLTETQYQGVITLIPKTGKDHLLPCNYRPILLHC